MTITRLPSFPLILMLILVAGVAAGCSSRASHPNQIPMEGAPNFRDVGGYQTVDGKHVKHGVLFRSNDLAELTRDDLETFEGLGIKSVYDLRHDYERDRKPSRLPEDDDLQVIEIPVYYAPLDRRVSREKILSGDVEEGHFHEVMVDANRAFAVDYNEQWSNLLRALTVEGSRPSLIHCADGKDRTGFAVAITLEAVGVPRETIYEDYLLSKDLLEHRTEYYSFLAWVGSFFRVSQSEVRPLLEVRREYLEAAYAEIEERYGSFDNYLREALLIDDELRAELRAALTE